MIRPQVRRAQAANIQATRRRYCFVTASDVVSQFIRVADSPPYLPTWTARRNEPAIRLGVRAHSWVAQRGVAVGQFSHEP
jgi:hypothetical protein